MNVDAETSRMRFITGGAGQVMTYMEKHNQANAVHDLGEAAANALSIEQAVHDFPTLAASIGLEASTLWGCALVVIARYEAWAGVSFAIERAKFQGKKNISDASNVAAAQAAYGAITWPHP